MGFYAEKTLIIKSTVVRNNGICGKKTERSLIFLEQGEMKVER